MNTNAKAQRTGFYSYTRCWDGARSMSPRAAQDFAQQMHLVVDVYFPEADRIRLVVDNLNTHTPAALYEAFAPAEARRITRKLEFHYTPKQGSWLNRAEWEFAVLRVCLAKIFMIKSRDDFHFLTLSEADQLCIPVI
jgi:hypothetical protein